MSNKLTDTALDLLMIEKDILYRIDYSKEDKHLYNSNACYGSEIK